MKQSLSALILSSLSLLPLGCKDDSPCDPGELAVGTACFREPTAGGGGSGGGEDAPAPTDGGAGAGGEATVEKPSGNPDATFGTACESNADCGGDAPLCDNKMFHYCLQTGCLDGEEHAGVCPEGWICVPPGETPDGTSYPSACINASGL